MSGVQARKPVFLLILDGLGLREEKEDNAFAAADTPVLDRLFSEFPMTAISASAEAVGLPKGYIGSSEVGHLNIGAGRVVLQGFGLINHAIATGEFDRNPAFVECFESVLQKGSSLHLMGLVSDGGVHSHIDHLIALLRLAAKRGLQKVFVHAFLDGRDVEPSCAKQYLQRLEEVYAELGVGSTASVHGRFYAMDRDKRYERVKKSYACLVHGEGEQAVSAFAAVDAAYARGESDEFVLPTAIGDGPDRLVAADDGVIFFNFREDRARELTGAFTQESFDAFERDLMPLHYVCMTEYDASFGLPTAFPMPRPEMSLGELIGALGGKQLRIAETEKYAHVTYFFSGGREEPYPGEHRVLIASDRSVKTYDEQPRMRTSEIADAAIAFMTEQRPDLVVCNIAAPDMVGHTGVFEAVVRAVEVVDEAIGRIHDACSDLGYVLFITADHGNCEEMAGKHQTSHTLNPVPFCVVEDGADHRLVPPGQGVLGDIAPTILRIVDVEVPREMDRPGLLLP